MQTPEKRVLTPVAAGAAAVSAALVGAATARVEVAVVAVLLVGLVLAVGWGRALDLPSQKGVSTVLGVVALVMAAVALADTDGRGERWLPVCLAAGMIGSFMHQLLRRDGRARLVTTIAGTALGIGVLGSGALMPVALRYEDGAELVSVVVVSAALGTFVDLAARRGPLASVIVPTSIALGAICGLLVGLVADVGWMAAVMVGALGAGTSHAIRRVLTVEPTTRWRLAQLAVGTGTVLACGVIAYCAAWLLR